MKLQYEESYFSQVWWSRVRLMLTYEDLFGHVYPLEFLKFFSDLSGANLARDRESMRTLETYCVSDLYGLGR